MKFQKFQTTLSETSLSKTGPFSMLVAAARQMILNMTTIKAGKTMELALTYRQAPLKELASLTISFVGAAEHGDVRSSTGVQ